MTRFTRICAWILLSFMSLSLIVGYAAISDNLSIDGDVTVEGKPFEGVYISDVSLYSVNGASSLSFDYYKPTTFSSLVSASRSGGSVTYKITVHNNTDITYWYIGQDFLPDVESNSLIGAANGITVVTKDHPTDSSSTFNSDDWVPPQTYRDFYVTYTFGSNAQGYPATLINFSFGIHMDAVHDKFLAVLNDSSPGGGYEYISSVFDELYAKTGETVIASVGDQKAVFDKLFGSNMTINVDGVDLPVTVMVQRENVDGRTTGDSYSGTAGAPTGCEYTVYITVDPLNSPTGQAIVYAVSYSIGGVGQTGIWHQLGQLYEGTADIIDYDTSTPGMQGAVDIDTWIATENEYVIANGIKYWVGRKYTGDQYDQLKTIKQIMSTNDQDIFNDIDNCQILKNVYAIVYNSANKNKSGYEALRQAFEVAAPFYNVMNNGQEVKVKRNSTRAEIIPYILNIQHALDYYNQVN